MAVLVTGGAGFIGSHTVVELLDKNKDVVVVDDLSNSKKESINKIEQITGKKVKFYELDLRDKDKLDKVFKDNKITSVIHFAGSKAVGESVQKPVLYYDNNIGSTCSLLECMKKHNVNNLVFSSSATVYGAPEITPIEETFPRFAMSPYGNTKIIIEDILTDVAKVDKNFNVALLRYFNPVGAHKSYLIGEDPKGIPNNLMPYITQVAIKKLKELSIFGNDYATKDGTCIRDYIHVVDLAKGHLAALEKLEENCGLVIYNLGTGAGYSVLDIVNAFIKVNKIDIPHKIVGRRAGDVTIYQASTKKAEKELGWKAELTLEDMCKDSYQWQLKNPEGFN